MLRGLIISILLVIVHGIALSQFEGVMDMKVTGSGMEGSDTLVYTMSIKNNLMATEVAKDSKSDESGRFVFRGDKQVFWIINDEEKSYLEISLKDKDSKIKSMKKGESQKSDFKIKKTGNKETILGYPVEEVIIEGKDEVTHVWGTTKLGNIYAGMMKSLEGIGGDEEDELEGWDEELAKLEIFPLRIISKENNKTVLMQEVTRIEQKNIPITMFEIPKGYKKQSFDFNIENMMKKLEQERMKDKEEDSDDPGMNVDMEKFMKQMENLKNKDKDTTDGG